MTTTDMQVLEDGDYALPANGGIWLTVRNLSVRIRDAGEGVSVTVYGLNKEMDDSIVETWAAFKEGPQ